MENKIVNEQLNKEFLEQKNKADSYIQDGNWLEAEKSYKQILLSNPNHYQSLITLGFILFSQEKLIEAKEILEQALEIDDENHDIYYMLGKIYKLNNNIENAIKCFTWSIDIEPQFQLSYVELFDLLFKTKQLTEVELFIEKAVSIFGENTDLYYQMANYYLDIEDYINAKKYLELCIKINKDFELGYELLANIFLNEKNKNEAIKYFKEVERLNPVNPVLHLLHGLEGKGKDGIQTEYAKKLFNFYAKNFDNSLNNLSYSVPEDLLELLKEKTNIQINKKSILDLGCGTGLFGNKIKPYATNLVGVDLSEKMLEKAKELNIYDKLENSDLVEFLNKETTNYELISSTDVFIYVGKLDEVFNQSNRLLNNNGLLVFSLESLEHYDSNLKQDLMLTETGRYVHSLNYIKRLAKENNFSIIDVATKTIRIEQGNPVIGYLCILEKITMHKKEEKKGFFNKLFSN